jgi:hypothetical protein
VEADERVQRFMRAIDPSLAYYLPRELEPVSDPG